MHVGGFLVRVARGVAESNSQRFLECLANPPLRASITYCTVSFITYIYLEVFLTEILVSFTRLDDCLGAGMAQWCEHSPPVARVQFPDSASYVG